MDIKQIEEQILKNKATLESLEIKIQALIDVLANEGVIVKEDVEKKEREIIQEIKEN